MKRYAIKKITRLDGSVRYGVYNKPWTFLWFIDPFVDQAEIFDTFERAKKRAEDLDAWFDSVYTKQTERVG